MIRSLFGSIADKNKELRLVVVAEIRFGCLEKDSFVSRFLPPAFIAFFGLKRYFARKTAHEEKATILFFIAQLLHCITCCKPGRENAKPDHLRGCGSWALLGCRRRVYRWCRFACSIRPEFIYRAVYRNNKNGRKNSFAFPSYPGF